MLSFAPVCFAGNPSTINVSVHIDMTLSMMKVSGDNQSGCVGKALSDPFVVRVVDLNGDGIAGIPIRFSTGSSGGTLSEVLAATDSNGEAMTFLTFGETPGSCTVDAEAHELEISSGSPQTFTANAVGDEWGPLGPEVNYAMPGGFTDGVNSLLSKLGGGVKIDSSTFSYAMKTRDCCPEDGGDLIVDGEIQGDGTISFGISGDGGVPGWSLPEIEKKFDFGMLEIELIFDLGVFYDFGVSLSGTGGKRNNLCDEADCFYGKLGVRAALGIGAKFEAILCTESFWTTKECTGIVIRPIHASAGLSGSMGWNQNGCTDGFSSSASIGDVTIKAEFNVWNGISVEWGHTFPGWTLF